MPVKARFRDNPGFHRLFRAFPGFSGAGKPVKARSMPAKADLHAEPPRCPAPAALRFTCQRTARAGIGLPRCLAAPTIGGGRAT